MSIKSMFNRGAATLRLVHPDRSTPDTNPASVVGQQRLQPPPGGMMEFVWEGVTYRLTFRRDTRLVQPRHPVEGVNTPVTRNGEVWFTPKFPATTVEILAWLPDGLNTDGTARPGVWTVYRTATVGCFHREAGGYNPERGRLFALQSVMEQLTKDQYKLMWHAYLTRPKQKGKPVAPVAPTATGQPDIQ